MLPLIALLACGLCLTWNVSAGNIHTRTQIGRRRTGTQQGFSLVGPGRKTKVPKVPTYNFSVPVDHFDASNKRTYPNRFFVNDTHYRPGGPVVFYDFGESGVDPVSLAQTLSEYGGATSSVMALASSLHGLVVGWEHRYYGYSQPVKMDAYSGFPVEGTDGYKYLTVEQSLEDVAYFANSFNKTKLTRNHVVNTTAALDPYHTPWIFVGASYPGSRAAWMRAKHPEIIYASWASSAPLQSQPDGSIYINPLVRALPKNCTSDLQAAIKYTDGVLASGSRSDREFVKYAVGQASSALYGSGSDADADDATAFDIGEMLYQALTFYGNYQYLGPTGSVQLLCDAMESFDTVEFLKAYDDSSRAEDKAEAILDNSADSSPPSQGVAASAHSNAGLGAFAAMTYGINASLSLFSDSLNTTESTYLTPDLDSASWEWQMLSEVGWFQGSNDSHAFRVLSKFINTTAVRDSYADYIESAVSDSGSSDVPEHINNTYLLDVGGWNAKISNVMFTNGEFDPWRAFSVASQETEDGAPGRNVTRTVPKCNEVSRGSTDVFGLVYPGEVHGSDIFVSMDSHDSSSQGRRPPAEVGLELFLEAWKAWEPCFKKSRDDVRNGKGVDGQGTNAFEGGGEGSAASRLRRTSGGLLPLIVSSSLVIGLLYL